MDSYCAYTWFYGSFCLISKFFKFREKFNLV
jgi:hypothetical protein